ncbi:AAA family ATPase [Streptomyces sp. S07_1.15]|uniref:AAA family ATPase n=1 Tax=Streptomyces sp. S07_1.15 TaxID=2873925 RepID=UPI001D13353A|nr:ATP-binding protein [Streptomyces sp. S07_1.15]MCC3651969.1 AAA family ATPase [Streptomyces sp. S07_1.15]
MYVSRLRVDGVRGFHGQRRVDLGLVRPDGSHAGWTVLAGRNGSGKTTLLRALAMAFLNEKHGSLTGGPEAWSASSSRSDPLIAVDMVAEGFHTTCRIGAGQSTGEPALSWSYEVHTPITPSSVPHDFCAGYGPHRRLTGGTVEVPASAVSAQRVATLFQEGAALGESVAWLIQQHLRRLEGRSGAQELIDAVFALLGDGLLPDDYRVVRVDSEGLWVRRGGREFPLREMSDGYRTVTAVVVDLLRHLQLCYGELPLDTSGDVPAVTLPGVVLIDEVDAHLHVSWQKRIGGWLTAHFPRIQFIVTTHSPYICQSADPGGLIRLAGPDEQEPPHTVDEDLYRRVVYGSGDDAVLSDLFGLDSPYSDRAEELRRRVGDLEGLVLSGEATPDQVEEYQQLSEILTSSAAARVDEVSARLARRCG